MPNFICTTCGTQYAESDQSPDACAICEDDRQYVKKTGQQWTTLDRLRLTNRNSIKFKESGLIGIGIEPQFAIGQRALFLRTPNGNILWDCLPLLDQAVVEMVKATTTELVGSRFEVRPMGGSFVCEVAQAITEKELVIQYVDGLHRGTGVWTLEPATDGTKLCYQIDLEPQGWLPRFLSHFMDFAGMHSRGMETLFDGLEAWLKGKSQ